MKNKFVLDPLPAAHEFEVMMVLKYQLFTTRLLRRVRCVSYQNVKIDSLQIAIIPFQAKKPV